MSLADGFIFFATVTAAPKATLKHRLQKLTISVRETQIRYCICSARLLRSIICGKSLSFLFASFFEYRRVPKVVAPRK